MRSHDLPFNSLGKHVPGNAFEVVKAAISCPPSEGQDSILNIVSVEVVKAAMSCPPSEGQDSIFNIVSTTLFNVLSASRDHLIELELS